MLRDQLIGAFELVSVETQSSDGTVHTPFGLQPHGMFLFEGSGYFSVQIAPGDAGTPATEPRQPDGGYLAMWGQFEVEEESQGFVLSVAGSNRPGLLGTKIRRYATLTGRVAQFRTEPVVQDDIESVTIITWRRLSMD